MQYAIISLGGKQYRVREGERLLVDRVAAEPGSTFTPAVRLIARDGDVDISPEGVEVRARVVQHVLGEKIRIGKYRRRTGYRRHTGYRSRLSQIEIESLGGQPARRATRREKPRDQVAAEAAEAKQAAATGAAAAETKLPDGYEDMTIPELRAAADAWDLATLEAALAYEREHAARKGAIAALEQTIAARQEN